MKTLNKLLLTLAATVALNTTVQADTLYGALRDGTAVRTTAGLIPFNFPPGTTDAQRYMRRPPVGSLHDAISQAPRGTTDWARQVAASRSPSPIWSTLSGKALARQE